MEVRGEDIFVVWPDSIRAGCDWANRRPKRASDAVAYSGSGSDRCCEQRDFI